MKKIRILPLCWSAFIFSLAIGYASGQTSVTTCELQENASNYLNARVDVRSMIIAGSGHFAFIHGEHCQFRIATGDDYQQFGKQYPATKNAQWKRMEQALSITRCGSNVRAVKAMFQGTVIRVPATGTIPPDEMGVELVIQSVSDVQSVPIKCRPRTLSR